jgi:hypothetical protein
MAATGRLESAAGPGAASMVVAPPTSALTTSSSSATPAQPVVLADSPGASTFWYLLPPWPNAIAFAGTSGVGPIADLYRITRTSQFFALKFFTLTSPYSSN